ncbi:hypothetical protein E4582_09280 [Luteimonas yindakuii]|uniref:Uncharacterized protein n=1 Tax=Luteimonas yindakuii TaxID=2565782 RepID=A0A4Z1R8L2_9GAMM|nr:hypothetical protein [Luteimonas yindakuii]QCO68498.1 hypothetical protein E5843_13300 [Luteimonas yindakuii]TKS54935.1 hypothetical protein E4582_09280 [Luteimonas yindakuii]
MRALFVGGTVDNSELDIEGDTPPTHYPPDTGTGTPRYRLRRIGRHADTIAYVVYGAPELPDEEVQRVAEERAYARRFEAEESAAAD